MAAAVVEAPGTIRAFFFTLVTGPGRSLSLNLSDTRVYEPQIRARLGTTGTIRAPATCPALPWQEREFFIDNLLVRIQFIIVMIRWTGLAPWEFEFPFPGSLTSTFVRWQAQRVAGQTQDAAVHQVEAARGVPVR